MEAQTHLSEEQLEQYFRGKLDSSIIAPFEEHLLVCSICRERLEETENYVVGTKEALREAPSLAPERARGWFEWLRRPAFSMAVGFAALVLVVTFFSRTGDKFAPTASLVLTAVRGEMPQTDPARQFDLRLADSPKDGGPFQVEVVTANGVSVWSGLVAPGPNGVVINEPRPLDAGDYFVRLSGSDGKPLREYGFRVRR